jgi:hypothetical protein
MKTLLAICILLALPLASCKKECVERREERASGCGEYFEFGYRGGLAGINKHFVISNRQLFRDSTSRPPLSAAKYNLAKPLLDHFPEYLLSRPNTIFGCRGCADQFTVELRRRISGTMYFWYLDMEMEQLPIELRAYVQEVYDVSNQL